MNKTADMAPQSEFGRWLHTNMLKNGWTCGDVAERLHTTRQCVRNHINGATPPSYVWVVAYCYLFGDDPNRFWKEET